MILADDRPFLGFAMAEDDDARGCGGDPFFYHWPAKESVDKGALARVKLAHDDQHEQVIELLDGLAQYVPVLGRRSKLDQCDLQVVQEFALVLEQFVLSLVRFCQGIYCVSYTFKIRPNAS